jgi:hypothetical protein
MGGHSSTSTSTTSLEKVNETNFQNSGGLTVAGNRGNTTVQNISTDAGAVAGGVALGRAAIGANSDVSQAAIDLGSQAISAGQQVANAGLSNAQAAYQGGLTFGSNALDTVQALADQFSQQNAQLTANALDGYQSIAQQNSASNSTQIQKIALWAIAAAVLIVIASSGAIEL